MIENPLHEWDPHRHMIVVRHPDSPRERRIAIGYWSADNSGNDLAMKLMSAVVSVIKGGPLPHPSNFVDEDWNEDEKDMVAKYLKSYTADDPRKAWGLKPTEKSGPQIITSYRGFSTCRMCDKMPNGSSCIGDDKFIWPSGFAHYIEEHSVRPPKEFIDHVRERATKSR